MSEYSEDFEREVLDAAREVRGAIRGLKLLIGGVLLFIVLSMVGAFVFQQFSGGDNGGGIGNDAHAPLKPGTSLTLTTEAGLQATAQITNLSATAGDFRLETKVKGTTGGAWFLYLTDNTRVPMQGSDNIGNTDGWVVRGYTATVPTGATVQFVQFNPDDSRGHMYFDVQP